MHSSQFFSIPRHPFYGVPWGVMFACMLGSIWFPAPAQQHGAAVLLVSAFLFGMPHGACDLIALRNVRGQGMSTSALTKLVGA